nr:ribbon-helix-helix domain-containing protein [Methylocapsa palsarum]
MATESDVSGRKSSANVKHSLSVAGHRTSITLEQAFWDGLRAIARRRGEPVASLVARIDADRGGANLSSAIRVFVLNATAAASRDGAANEPGSGVSEASFEGL